MKIQATRKEWVMFVIVLILWLAFLVWLKSWLGLVVVPFIFDAYITKLIPWTWWTPVPSLQGPCDRSLKSEVPCGSCLNWR